MQEEEVGVSEVSGNVGSIGKFRLQRRLGCLSIPSHHICICIAFIIIFIDSFDWLALSPRHALYTPSGELIVSFF